MSHKLPIREIFTKALSLPWERRVFALRISWPFVLASVLVVVAGAIYLASQPASPPAPGEPGTGVSAVEFMLSLAQTFFVSILAVYWHRNILLHETDAPAVPLRFDAYVWRYLGYGLLLVLMVVTVSVLGGISAAVALKVGAGADSTSGVALVVALVLVLMATAAVLVVMLRCQLVLPAAAIGDRKTGLRRSWRLTRGNTWRLLTLMLVPTAILIMLNVAIAIVSALFGEIGVWLRIAGSSAAGWAACLVTLSILSLIYHWLMHEAQPSGPAA